VHRAEILQLAVKGERVVPIRRIEDLQHQLQFNRQFTRLRGGLRCRAGCRLGHPEPGSICAFPGRNKENTPVIESGNSPMILAGSTYVGHCLSWPLPSLFEHSEDPATSGDQFVQPFDYR
jgi:hypothetical protein